MIYFGNIMWYNILRLLKKVNVLNKKEQRISDLISIIKEQPTLSVKNLAEILNVSEMTIRRDIDYLKANNILNQVHGMNFLTSSNNIANVDRQYDISTELTKFNTEKDKIGEFASTLIEPGDIIVIDSGTTTAAISKYVPENINLTVLCYNYYTLSHIYNKQGVSLIFPGGYYHHTDQMFESSEGLNLIKNHRANKLFLSASGVHEKLGITCAHNYEVLTKRAVISSSLTRILLADSSKFGLVHAAYFAHLNEIDVIVTDDGISKEWRDIIEEAGIKLYIV